MSSNNNKRWFSRMGRGRPRETDAVLTAEVQTVRDRRQQLQPNHDDGGQRPCRSEVLSEPSPLTPPPPDRDHNPRIVEVQEEMLREEPRRSRQPPSLFGSTEGVPTGRNHVARDVLAATSTMGEELEIDRYQRPSMESNRNPMLRPSSSFNDPYDPPPNRTAYMGPPPSYNDRYDPPSHRNHFMGPPPSSSSYNDRYDRYDPPNRDHILGPPSSSYNSPSYPPSRDSSSLHDMASAKMAAYQGSSRGGGGGEGGNSDAIMIPIAPGVSARLRGANETFECIERDFYIPVTCFACSLEMCCIQDADYVICPVCRVVSPLDNGMHEASPHVSHGLRGQRDQTVGLGFTYEDLCKWQAEILAKRNAPTV